MAVANQNKDFMICFLTSEYVILFFFFFYDEGIPVALMLFYEFCLLAAG